MAATAATGEVEGELQREGQQRWQPRSGRWRRDWSDYGRRLTADESPAAWRGWQQQVAVAAAAFFTNDVGDPSMTRCYGGGRAATRGPTELQRRGRAVEVEFQTREAVWPNGGLRGQGFAVVQRTTVAMAASTARGGGAVCIRITVVERRSGAEEEVADAKKKTRNERESNRNCLAAQPLPPGDAPEVSVVLEFGLNRLAGLNVRQATRHSVWVFLAFGKLVINKVEEIGTHGLIDIETWGGVGSGAGRALAPGSGKVPPGDLGLFRLAALGATPGRNSADIDLCLGGEVHIKLLLRGDTSGEVRGWWITCVGLRAGRSVEQDYERGGYTALGLRSWPRTNSLFLFVYGDDCVIRYMGADVNTGDVEDAQATDGAGRALAPGSGKVPPGDLGLFRLAALGATPGRNSADIDLCLGGEVHIKLLLRGDTSGEVRGWWITCVGLRAGRSVEQDYERGGYTALGLRSWPRTNSLFLFVYGDDCVIRYMGADVNTGDVEDAQATE
ncbi:hypothetical protein DEO72_LG9g1051 [Vigna unguiculata]|uniref:Uncharacterized protein n=1 Tax=Vigna unguiculata TaxID=3917 RepID=A0A4D6MZE1_VIGUN|nr:hypothetical protein DEO72_LG9g1051 [Vigna unguiculata]